MHLPLAMRAITTTDSSLQKFLICGLKEKYFTLPKIRNVFAKFFMLFLCVGQCFHFAWLDIGIDGKLLKLTMLLRIRSALNYLVSAFESESNFNEIFMNIVDTVVLYKAKASIRLKWMDGWLAGWRFQVD